MAVAKFHSEVISVATLVVEDADGVGAVVASLCPCDRVAFNFDGLGQVCEVLRILAAHEAAEEVQFGEELVKNSVLVVSCIPECCTVVVRLDIARQMLFLAIQDDGNAVCKEHVGADVFCTTDILSVIPKTGNVMVLFHVSRVHPKNSSEPCVPRRNFPRQ